MNLFEDMVNSGCIFFNSRIVRITETLLYAVRLYSFLKVPLDSKILIGIRHGGLKNRILSASGGAHMIYDRKTIENEVYTEVETTFEKIENNLTDIVAEFTNPLFLIFDFFALSKAGLDNYVNNFVEGRIM
jgi:hypothetical protein